MNSTGSAGPASDSAVRSALAGPLDVAIMTPGRRAVRVALIRAVISPGVRPRRSWSS